MGTKGPIFAASLLLAVAGAAEIAGAEPASLARAGSAGEVPAYAIVSVRTPELPAGRTPDARERWQVVRSHSGEVLTRVAVRNALDVDGRIPETGKLLVGLGDETVAQLQSRLSAEPRVDAVQPEGRVELRYVPNDTAFTMVDLNAPGDHAAQWNVRDEGGPAAWDLSRGAGAEVAVIDTGVDGTHPDLAGRITAAEGFGLTPLDPGPTVDSVGHGTHVAGLACGDSDNGFGIASLGFDCSIYAAKIDIDKPTACFDVASAITAAGNRFSDAVNLSLGCSINIFGDELAYAWSRGAVPVVAGANQPVPNPATNYPAQSVQPDGTGQDLNTGIGLVVTAAKEGGTRASFAQKTTGVSVAAFGAATDQIGGQQGILSTFPPPTVDDDAAGGRTSVGGSNRFAYLVGTSMATPQVAGLVALMRAVRPNLPAPKVVRLIKLTASGCGTYANGIGWGVIDARQAVAAALDRDVNPPHSNVRDAGRRRVSVKSFERGCSAELPSSGVKKVVVFASANGGRYRRVGKTSGKSLRFRGKQGRRYRFYSVAIDNAGNREAAPSEPDARLRVKRRGRR